MRLEGRQIFCNWVIAFIAAGAVIVAIIQGCFMSQQSAAMIEQNGLARDTASKQLRAYVTVSGYSVNPNASPNGKDEPPNDEVAYTVVIKNSGQTIAKELEIHAWITIEDRRFNGPFDFSELAPGRHISRMVLGPGIDSSLTKSRPISTEERKAIGEGKKAVWFYGEIIYRDIFGKTQETHWRLTAGGRAETSFDNPVYAQDGNDAT